MKHSPDTSQQRWTLNAFIDGAVTSLPAMPGIFLFGMAFGTAAAGKGFTLVETVMMNGIVFAGMAQFVSLEVWPQEFTAATMAAAGMVAGMVCLRFVLMGASLRPWLGGEPALKVYPTFYILTDSNWLLAMRYRAQGGTDPNFLVGSCALTWVVWVLSAAPGYWLGASIADPHRYGLDLVMPVFFISLIVPLWRGVKPAIGWLVAAVVSLLAYVYLGGWWYVPLGAIAGAVTGGLLHERE